MQKYLEESGATVFITRNDDTALGDKKNADLNERKKIANESEGDIFISIHQNAFPDASVKGAQVFYHNASDEGKALAQLIQQQLKEVADPGNHRQIKANTDYYVLKNTTIPAVIVECGFITHLVEEKQLLLEAYQEKIAWAIYKGIVTYFNDTEIKK